MIIQGSTITQQHDQQHGAALKEENQKLCDGSNFSVP